jgi:hypothetical protein
MLRVWGLKKETAVTQLEQLLVFVTYENVQQGATVLSYSCSISAGNDT